MNKKNAKLDQMFAGFNAVEDSDVNDSNDEEMQVDSKQQNSNNNSAGGDINKKKKKKNKKSGKAKREAERNLTELEQQIANKDSQKRQKADNVNMGSEQVNTEKDYFDEEEEERLAKEAEMIEKVIQIEQNMDQVGYNEEDYEVERMEWPNCIHEYVQPKGYDRPPYKRPAKRAKEYKFTLDKFQERAVECIERNESVLVAAHTSAGKTAVAEYAIALALNSKQRVIYTSPIKALSNQKYRELQEEFVDVGLMTGDVTINESASCIVMTTEILRSMLYNGSEITREMAWVIFDEVHYMRDKERGVVWEETMILLPTTVKYVFLSATIPNAREFAEWIVKIKKQPCSVVYTDYRPTPLQHFIYPMGGEGIYCVVDQNGQFKEQNFTKAISVLENDMNLDKILDDKKNRNKTTQQKTTQNSEMKKIITLIVDKGLDPCIVFSFSKRDCEAYAMALKGCDFNKDEEKDQIKLIFNNAMSSLAEEDAQLPTIQSMLPLLQRGIGIHHGGLLPIVKEVIELLFQEGLLKILFTTETFSMGINMPARTVVFTSIEKFDGDEYRWITGGEFIQMSGRAGRRGLDDRGVTIMIANKKLEPDVAKNILKGQSDPLYSAFHLGYNMLLNMMRLEDISPEDIILKSFHQFQNERACPQMKAKLTELIAEYKSINIPLEDKYEKKTKYISQRQQIDQKINTIVCEPENIMPFMVPGRLVKICSEQQDWGWGIVVSWTKQKINPKKFMMAAKSKTSQALDILSQNENHFILDVYLYVKNRLTNDNLLQPGDAKAKDGRLGVCPVIMHHTNIAAISTIQVNLPHNLKDQDNAKQVENMFFQIMQRFEFGAKIPLLDPIKDMEIENSELKKFFKAKTLIDNELQKINEKYLQNQSVSDQHEILFARKKEIKHTMTELEESVKKASEMIMKNDLVNMKRVMRRLEMCEKTDQPTLKGKVACSISASDELLVTELLFSGMFQNMEPNQIAALCSCLVFTDVKGEVKMPKEEKFTQPFQLLQQAAEKIATIMVESKIPLDKEEYVQKFRPDIMEITYKWCQGAKFKEICEIAQDVYEGTIIRAFRRLDELLSQMTESCKIIGNMEQKRKFEEAQKGLKRGIVFAASLYL